MIIIQDSREQNPWDFLPYGHNQRIEGMKTGDYTVKGFEELFIVERKRNTGELAMNVGKKRKQFFAELERMKPFRFKHIICEFDVYDLGKFPVNSGIPQKLWKSLRINSQFLMSCIDKIVSDCDIRFHFCEGKIAAERKFLELFNEAKTSKKI